MLIKYMQEATFYINAKGILFIMTATVLIALLKKCQQSNTGFEKLSFLLPCHLSGIKMMAVSV